jgi:hypothetical protein
MDSQPPTLQEDREVYGTKVIVDNRKPVAIQSCDYHVILGLRNLPVRPFSVEGDKPTLNSSDTLPLQHAGPGAS